MLIVLREFSQRHQETACSILDYIVEKSNSMYQIIPPAGAIEYLLLKGRAIVIFDGLDELLESNQRQEMTRKIEAFCNLYPAIPVVVTSRKVGYQQAPLDPERFSGATIATFNSEQVEEYTRNWFTTNPDVEPDKRDELIKSFLNDLKIVPEDVKESPLMLSLLCGMHYSAGYLPRIGLMSTKNARRCSLNGGIPCAGFGLNCHLKSMYVRRCVIWQTGFIAILNYRQVSQNNSLSEKQQSIFWENATLMKMTHALRRTSC